MTIASTTNRIRYAGNGVTTSFSFPYPFFAQADLVVTLFVASTNIDFAPAPVLNGAATYDYTITGTFDADLGEYVSGANVIFNTAPITGYTVVIARAVSPTQSVALVDGSRFPANTVNTEFDKLTVLYQQGLDAMSRALLFPTSDATTLVGTLPPSATRASMYLGFDSSGNPTVISGTVGEALVSSFWEPVLLLSSAALSRTALGVPGLTDNNTFSGTNSFSAASTFTGAVAIGTAALTLTGNIAATRAVGAAAAGTVTPYSFSVTFSGDAGGTTDMRSMDFAITASGANAIAQLDAYHTATEVQTTAGTMAFARANESYVRLGLAGSTTGNITSARVYEGHIANEGSGTIATGFMFYANDVDLAVGTGPIQQVAGFRSGNLGHATRVTTSAIGFDATDMTAGSPITAAFRSTMASGTNKWSFLGGSAVSAFSGDVRIGSQVAPTATLDVTGTAKVSSTLAVTGALSTGSSLTTGAPNTGTAGAWKFGILVSTAVTQDLNKYLQVDIGGTLFKVAVCN